MPTISHPQGSSSENAPLTHRMSALARADRTNAKSKSGPNTSNCGSVANSDTDSESTAYAGGGGKDVRSWMSVERR